MKDLVWVYKLKKPTDEEGHYIREKVTGSTHESIVVLLSSREQAR
jgi:hypothetical protein